jgi:hypothetical protein
MNGKENKKGLTMPSNRPGINCGFFLFFIFPRRLMAGVEPVEKVKKGLERRHSILIRC